MSVYTEYLEVAELSNDHWIEAHIHLGVRGIARELEVVEDYVTDCLRKRGFIEWKAPHWSIAEDEAIATFYPKYPRRFLNLALVGRTAMAISKRASKHGISNSLIWTDRDKEILLRFYIEYPTNFLVPVLLSTRSTASIRKAAFSLGLAGNKKVAWTKEKRKELQAKFKKEWKEYAPDWTPDPELFLSPERTFWPNWRKFITDNYKRWGFEACSHFMWRPALYPTKGNCTTCGKCTDATSPVLCEHILVADVYLVKPILDI